MIYISGSDVKGLNFIEIGSLKDIVRKQLKPYQCVDLNGNQFVILERLYTIFDEDGSDVWYFMLLNLNQNKKLFIVFFDDLRNEKMTIK